MKLRKEEKERSKEKEEKKPPTPPIGLAHFSVDNSVDNSGWLVAPPARADGGRTPSLPVKSSVFHVAGRKMGMTDADVDAWIRYQKDTGWTYTSGRPITASNFHRSLRMWREINKVIEERNASPGVAPRQPREMGGDERRGGRKAPRQGGNNARENRRDGKGVGTLPRRVRKLQRRRVRLRHQDSAGASVVAEAAARVSGIQGKGGVICRHQTIQKHAAHGIAPCSMAAVRAA